MKWISMKDEWPKMGQKVILFSNGVVQNELYTFDCTDINDYLQSYFWDREELDECPEIKETDFWMPLPDPPEVK